MLKKKTFTVFDTYCLVLRTLLYVTSSSIMSEHPNFRVERDCEFSDRLLSDLHGLQQSHTLTDFTVHVGEKSIPCHKVCTQICHFYTFRLYYFLVFAQRHSSFTVCMFILQLVKVITVMCLFQVPTDSQFGFLGHHPA